MTKRRIFIRQTPELMKIQIIIIILAQESLVLILKHFNS
jgi:hypothetical protein